ncbi:MAG: nucleotide exchange factor GrpE, partial [Candidatus Aenigmarchaeota archaeon]|nr:nucleotide exchange factor GrpE [Candidatus Aenigmarchaeota archaeon]
MHAEQRLESETLKWLGKLQERVKGLPKASDSKVAAELENVHAYLKDCQHFLDRKDYVNAFEAVIYAWGILETMERMGLLEQDGKRAGTGMPDKGRKLEEEAAGKAKEAQEANDRLKYLQADFDNYRKHFEKERQSVIELASAGVITELLPLLDELALTAQHARDQNDREGIKLLDEKLIK